MVVTQSVLSIKTNFSKKNPPRFSREYKTCTVARSKVQDIGLAVATGGIALLTSIAQPSLAEIRLPPLDPDPNRCERGYIGNTIGQANAVSDKVLDLRFCDYAGKSLAGKTLAGALLEKATLSNANLQEAVLTKAYAVKANFNGADLTNAVIDRVDFGEADLSNAKLVNAVITGANFKDANLDGANFEDALIGSQDAKQLCQNPTLVGDSRYQVGCRSGK
eukprot:TRINITY_DN1263_c0_g1_i1.p2 TRINITY_DN1263_c0_g1~~TRINITY_DN1263_c0_g1_i1.p2  ORF type:complete len:234 (-),score=27.77 TRINITY_DN1263_c0_g1_i1:228-887(-)